MNVGDDDNAIAEEAIRGQRREKRSKGKRRKHSQDRQSTRTSKKNKKELLEQRNPASILKDIKERSVYSAAPITDSGNLASKPEALLYSPTNVRKYLIKAAQPYQTGANLSTESFLHFNISSNKNEWIRFKPDGLSVVIYGVHTNADFNAAGANDMIKARYHALRSRNQLPKIWIDPSVGMSGFVKGVEVSIDNVPVPTNSTISNLFLQYVRFSRIFCSKPTPYISCTKDLDFTAATLSKPILAATEPFDYKAWNVKEGNRCTMYLDGIFPFSLKNKTLEAIENEKAEHLWFPPNVSVDIRVHLHRSKMESIFHDGIDSFTEYFSTTAAIEAPQTTPQISISSASLEYEVIELNQDDHIQCLKEFANGRTGVYKYDIPRGQHQALPPNMSFTQNVFQILPFAKLIYIAFLPDWATFVMENKRKPLSGFSKFPAHCSKMTVSFASEPLLVQEFEGLGSRFTRHELSKKIEYQYKRKLGITNATFDQCYPRSIDGDTPAGHNDGLIQVLVFELSTLISSKSEYLKIDCTFGGGHTSPVQQQIIVISVHCNGQATCIQRPGTDQWQWSFAQNA